PNRGIVSSVCTHSCTGKELLFYCGAANSSKNWTPVNDCVYTHMQVLPCILRVAAKARYTLCVSSLIAHASRISGPCPNPPAMAAAGV
ncbi:hypothetical protein GBAR_LOCUS10325, partial [Geodia barretti]